MTKSKKLTNADHDKSDEVKRQLTKHVEIDTSAVSVKSSNNHVELSGDVDNNMAKRLAETIASTEVSEVTDVTNNIIAHRDVSQAPENTE